MTVPNIDTFENDISDEIKHKEATIGDIASASGDIGNTEPKKQNPPSLLIFISIFIILITGIILYFGYKYYDQKVNPPINTAPIVAPKTNDTSLLQKIHPSFIEAFGRFIINVEKKGNGYILTFSNATNAYSSVFAYMIKNESLYADDIAQAIFSPKNTTSTTTTPFIFSDITINNQNMRVGKSGSSTVVYAFINTNNLVISSSTEGIFLLRNDISR